MTRPMTVFAIARRTALLVTAAGCALASPAFAQDTTDEPEEEARPERRDNAVSASNDTIVVTATKKKNVENVQDVAVAVTAFGSDSLEALKVRTISDLTYSAPNVSLDDVGTARGTANFSIRGLGVNSSIPSIDPTVGLFVDGVYMGVNSGVLFDVFDLDSVELVRGPQGILFGRNTTGGAVLLNTGNPTDDFRLKFRASIDGPVDKGRGGINSTVQAAISGPLVENVLNYKFAVYHNDDTGYFTNLANGNKFGAAETTIVRAGLELRPTETLTIVAKGESFNSKGQGPAAQNHGRYSRDSFDFAIDNEGSYTSKTNFATIRADLDVGNGVITNIFGYRDSESTTDGDIDSTPVFFFHSDTAFSQDQWSNELRYAGEFGPLDLTVGGYIFQQNLGYDEFRNLPFVTPATFAGGGAQKHDVYGIFAQFDYDILETLTVTAGIRWSQEEKTARITYVRPRPVCSVRAGTCPTTGTNPFVPGEPNGYADSNSWSNWTPKLGLQYRFSDDAQAYASWTRGVRSGGYNFRNTDPAVFLAQIVPATGGNFYFDEEKVDSYEVGLKYQTADRRGTLNLAAYYTDIGNMQRELNVPSASGVSQFILNTADASIKGFEAEGRYAVTDSLLLTANFGFIDDSYDLIFFDISGATGVTGGVIDAADYALRLPRVPKTTWGIGLLYDLAIGNDNSVVTRVNFQHRDRFAYTDNNTGWIPAIDSLDANITWNTSIEGLSLSVYGKNLLDQAQQGGDTQLPFSAGPLSNGVSAPFDPRPAAGTFSPLSKGRLIGIEVSLDI